MNYDLFVKNEKRGASSLRCAKRGRERGNLESTDWLPVRADNNYPKQLLGFRRETNGKYYPGAMYRARNANQNFKTDNSIEQAMMNIKEEKILIYPNPTTGTINFISSETPYTNATVVVYDLTGRAVSKEIFNGYTNSISLLNHPKGMYSVKITQGETITNHKIILQ